MRLNEAVQRFGPALVIEVAPRTCEWYLQKLAGLMAFVGAECEVETIRTDTLRVWLADLARQAERRTNHPTRPTREGGLSPYTLAGYVRTMRRFFGWLYEEEHLEDNPAARLKLPKLPKEPPKAVAPNDLDLLLEAAWASGDRDYALVCFLADTGCRVGGLASLTLDALDLDAGEATVREKGEKTRGVFLVPRTVAALAGDAATRRGASRLRREAWATHDEWGLSGAQAAGGQNGSPGTLQTPTPFGTTSRGSTCGKAGI